MNVTLSGGVIAPGTAKNGAVGKRYFQPTWHEDGVASTVLRALPGTQSVVIVEDREYARITGPVVTDFVWNACLKSPFTRSSSNESVVVPDPESVNHWLYVSDGTATLTVESVGRSVTTTVTASVVATNTVDAFIGYAAGSLRRHLSDSIDTRIAGLTASTTTKRIYSVQDHTAGVYVRNPSCWAASVDLTPISPWNSTGGPNMAGILISPRHILFATHYQIGVGASVRFVTTDNVTVTRTMTARARVGTSDFTIGLLDSDVPASISFARVMPANWAAYMPGYNSTNKAPGIGLDAQEHALVLEVSSFGSASGAAFYRPLLASRLAFSEALVGGDSGNPGCFIVNGQLVVESTWTGNILDVGAGGPSAAYLREDINATMTTLGGGYQLTPVDLSGYLTY